MNKKHKYRGMVMTKHKERHNFVTGGERKRSDFKITAAELEEWVGRWPVGRTHVERYRPPIELMIGEELGEMVLTNGLTGE